VTSRVELEQICLTMFAARGFDVTSVDDIARHARVTTGALHLHFPTKAALFETVFGQVHEQMLVASADAALGDGPELDRVARVIDAFFDAVLEPHMQQIVIIHASAVLGLARFTELDERPCCMRRPRPARCASTIPTRWRACCWAR